MSNPSALLPHLQVHHDAAVAHFSAGRAAEAAHLCQQLLAEEPRHAQSWNMLGALALREGRHEVAVDLIGKALASDPAVPSFYFNLGIALAALKQCDKARAAFGRAIELKPDFAGAHFRLGALLADFGQVRESIAALVAAIKINPGFAAAYARLGTMLQSVGKSQEAVSVYRKAITLDPANLQVHANLAAALADLGELDEAIASSRYVIGVDPQYAHAYVNLATALIKAERYEEGLLACDDAIRLDPTIAHAYSNRGKALNDLSQLDEAIAAYGSAFALKPDFAEAHFNQALAYLVRGDFEHGWQQFEWRLRRGAFDAGKRTMVPPKWEAQDIRGGTVLLQHEQGLGDTIQFSRYALSIQERGGRVVLQLPRHILRLMGSMKQHAQAQPAEAIQLIAAGDPVPACDFQLPLMSTPGVFGTRLDTIPDPGPYLFAEQTLRQKWAERIGPAGFKIGIAWQGNPNAAVDLGRSMALSCFALLAAIPGVRLISLQKGHGVEQLSQLRRQPGGMQVETLGEDFDSGPDAFVDTAAVMMHLDLVISVDTATGHLAGALGRPVWLVLQAMPHWVWLLERSDSPWYSSVRLFRQRERGNWESVIASMAQALRLQLSQAANDPLS